MEGKITDLSVKLQGRQRILVCPLDWGLGHASRCVPIIELALGLGVEVEVASSRGALFLLQKRFPDLVFHQLPTYGVRYPSRYPVWNLFLALPRLLWAIRGERLVLRKLTRGSAYDLLISDNRLGCFVSDVPSVYMTHQLRFAFRQKWLARLAAGMHAFWYRRFSELWVPDSPPPNNLSGVLSLPLSGDTPVYLGVLSQLSAVLPLSVELRYDIAVILSGPEPQRSRLEKEIMDQLEQLTGRFVLVRGVPVGEIKVKTGKHIEVVPFAGAGQIARIMAGSQLVVCRSGYSSIMDLQQMRKRALLIPTPGQPEQEYLARWLAGRDQFAVQQQGAVDLRRIWPFAQADTTGK